MKKQVFLAMAIFMVFGFFSVCQAAEPPSIFSSGWPDGRNYFIHVSAWNLPTSEPSFLYIYDNGKKAAIGYSQPVKFTDEKISYIESLMVNLPFESPGVHQIEAKLVDKKGSVMATHSQTYDIGEFSGWAVGFKKVCGEDEVILTYHLYRNFDGSFPAVDYIIEVDGHPYPVELNLSNEIQLSFTEAEYQKYQDSYHDIKIYPSADEADMFKESIYFYYPMKCDADELVIVETLAPRLLTPGSGKVIGEFVVNSPWDLEFNSCTVLVSGASVSNIRIGIAGSNAKFPIDDIGLAFPSGQARFLVYGDVQTVLDTVVTVKNLTFRKPDGSIFGSDKAMEFMFLL